MLKGQKKSTPYRIVKLRCRNCNNIVQRHRYLIKTFKYCCLKCKQLASRKRTPKSKIKYIDLIPCVCKNPDCKKVLKLVPYKAKPFKYCSKKCFYHTSFIKRVPFNAFKNIPPKEEVKSILEIWKINRINC